MTAPIDDEEVVVSLRLQPVVARPDGWRGRSSSLVAVGLVGFIVVGIALGAAFDDSLSASSAAAVVPTNPPGTPTPTRRPSSTRRPQLPRLPDILVLGGQIPTERRLVSANGMQVLDLATGALATAPRSYEDLVFPLGADQLVCACLIRRPSVGDATTSGVVIQFERLDTSGTTIVGRDVLRFDDIEPVPDVNEGFTMVAVLSADQRFLFVLSAGRRPPVWIVELHQIDVGSGELVGSTVVDSFPVDLEEPAPAPSAPSPTARPPGSPPDGVYVWANTLAMSPDGAYLEASIYYSETRADVWTGHSREWLVPVSDGRPGVASPLTPAAQLDPNSWCLGPPAFVDSELFVQVCYTPNEQQTAGEYRVRRVTTTGESLGTVSLPWEEGVDYISFATAVDRARRSILVWNPVRHSLARIAIDDGSVEVRDVARSMVPDEGQTRGRGYFGADPGLVLEPGGGRLFALGFGSGTSDAGIPTGVWVFDAETLNLVDHWLPRAMLISMAVSLDGRFVYASGAAGFDVEGNENPWPASVTVYDASSGEIQVIYGAVAQDTWVWFRAFP